MQHDPQLAMLALTLAGFSGLTFTVLIGHGRSTGAAQRRLWTLLAGLTLGCGLWTFFYLSLLALDPGMLFQFAFADTLIALGLALLTGLATAGAQSLPPRRQPAAVSALCFGGGAAAVHLQACGSIVFEGAIRPNALSIVLAVGAAVALAYAAFRRLLSENGTNRILIASLLMAASLAVLHLIALFGARVDLAPAARAVQDGGSRAYLILATTLSAAVILSLSLFGALMEQRLAGRAANDARRLRNLADATTEGIALIRDQMAQSVNASFAAMAGRPADSLEGQRFDSFFHESDRETIARAVAGADSLGREVRLIGPGGQTVPVQVAIRLLEQEGDQSMPVAVILDLREKRAAEAKIRHLSQHDTLTNLPNRSLFYDRLNQALERGRRRSTRFALLLVDIHRFKQLNEVKGQPVGDAILRAVGSRLQETVRACDTLARLAGDQYAILQEELEDRGQADLLARRLLSAMQAPIRINGEDMAISVSIGVTLYPEDGDDESTLLAHVESALKRAKQDQSVGFRFFEPDMDREQRERQALAVEMREGFSRGEFEVHYQPIARCLEGEVIGFEALLRWHHPERGRISPGIFVPVSEESGFISELGKWVVETVSREAASWSRPLYVSANVSPVQFRSPDLVRSVARALDHCGLAPDRLELEVTEGALIHDFETALALLNQLKALGVRIALDDFGTGYSSLSYLQSFPFDKIKIDRSFVLGLGTNPQSTAIVRGVIGLARGLGVPVVAEGVETEEHLAALRQEGCDLLQGYYIGKPQPLSAYGDLVRGPAVAVGSL